MKKSIFTIYFLVLSCSIFSQDFISKWYANESMDEFVIKDFDGDGDLDVFGLNYPFSPDAIVYLFLNESPFFTATKKYELFSSYTCSGKPYSFDIDNDGDFDIILAKGSQLEIVAFINDGKAKFTETNLNIKGSDQFNVLDMDKDGDLDIVGINDQSTKINLYTNNGDNTYTSKLIGISNLSSVIRSFKAGDIDGDGDGDFCVGYRSFNGEQIVLLNNQNQTKFDTILIESGNFDLLNKIDLVDINKDNKLDIVATNRNNGVVCWINSGGNKFVPNQLAKYSGTSGFGFTEFTFADFNGDQLMDIIVADFDNGTYRLTQTSSSPLKFDITKATAMTPANTIEAADLDGDKDLDLLISNGDLWYCENNITQITTKTDNIEKELKYFIEGNRIKLSGKLESKYYASIYNLNGNLIKSEVLSDNEILLPKLPAGIYYLQIIYNNKLNVIRIKV